MPAAASFRVHFLDPEGRNLTRTIETEDRESAVAAVKQEFGDGLVTIRNVIKNKARSKRLRQINAGLAQ